MKGNDKMQVTRKHLTACFKIETWLMQVSLSHKWDCKCRPKSYLVVCIVIHDFLQKVKMSILEVVDPSFTARGTDRNNQKARKWRIRRQSSHESPLVSRSSSLLFVVSAESAAKEEEDRSMHSTTKKKVSQEKSEERGRSCQHKQSPFFKGDFSWWDSLLW